MFHVLSVGAGAASAGTAGVASAGAAAGTAPSAGAAGAPSAGGATPSAGGAAPSAGGAPSAGTAGVAPTQFFFYLTEGAKIFISHNRFINTISHCSTPICKRKTKSSDINNT